MFKRHKDLNKFIYFIVLVIGILIGYSISNRKQIECEQLLNETDSKNTNDEIISFEGFNNITGTINITIIPNLIHYVHLNQEKINFIVFLSILSSWLNQKPDFIYLHCNKCNYTGKYWLALQKHKQIKSILKIKRINYYEEKIFNQKPGYIHHVSDVIRLLVLMNYGGFYLDNDMIIINSLNKYRYFEMVVSWQ